PVDLFCRKYLSIRGGSPCEGDENSKQSQLRLIREMLDVVEEVDSRDFNWYLYNSTHNV
ncbi:13171_t:CDS:1, partial [Dentiscutata erythropus]